MKQMQIRGELMSLFVAFQLMLIEFFKKRCIILYIFRTELFFCIFGPDEHAGYKKNIKYEANMHIKIQQETILIRRTHMDF